MSYSFSKISAANNVAVLWSPDTSGDYAANCEKGRKYADEVVAAMRDNDNPALLGSIVRSFGKDESRHGIEVGFLHRIAEYTLA